MKMQKELEENAALHELIADARSDFEAGACCFQAMLLDLLDQAAKDLGDKTGKAIVDRLINAVMKTEVEKLMRLVEIRFQHLLPSSRGPSQH